MLGMQAIALILCAGLVNVEAASTNENLKVQAAREQASIMQHTSSKVSTMQHSALKVNEESPYRRAVDGVTKLLHKMSSKIADQGVTRKKTYDEEMCACQEQGVKIKHDLDVWDDRLPMASSEVKQAQSRKYDLNYDIDSAKKLFNTDEQEIKEATTKHDKKEEEFNAEAAELKKNIKAVREAIKALREGLAASFLQTPAAALLQNVVIKMQMNDNDRDLITSFLVQDHKEESPGTEEVIGILTEMNREMMEDLKKEVGEQQALDWETATFVTAKRKEEDSLEDEIEDKGEAKGEVAITLIHVVGEEKQLKEQIQDAKVELTELEKDCKMKKAQYREFYDTMQEELKAISETIAILTSDESSSVFESADGSLKSAWASSFLQLQETADSRHSAAIRALQSSGSQYGGKRDSRIDLILKAMQGKAPSLTRVVGMIDRLKDTMVGEQEDDDRKKVSCTADLAERKAEEQKASVKLGKAKSLHDQQWRKVRGLFDEIESWHHENWWKSLDLTRIDNLRKALRGEYLALLASNNKAIEILGVAENRLNKFYNPKVYEMSAAEGTSFVQIAAKDMKTLQKRKATEVLETINLIKQELKHQNENARAEDEEYTRSYEEYKVKINEDIKKINLYIAQLESVKAEEAETMVEAAAAKSDAQTDYDKEAKLLSATLNECENFLKYYDLYKQTRKSEIEGLESAKLVLSGGQLAPAFLQSEQHSRQLRVRRFSA